MKITFNGENKEIDENLSISELLKQQKVESIEMVSVELNEKILARDAFNLIKLKENDKIEFLYFMGGGAINYA